MFLSCCTKHATLTVTDFFKIHLEKAAAAVGQGLGGLGGGPPPHASPLTNPDVCGSNGAKAAPGKPGRRSAV